MRAIPFNVAEAVFEPFWDPQLSGLSEWQVADGRRHGLEVRQFWCWVEFSWTRAPRSGPALSMQRSLDLDCSGYDRLLFSPTGGGTGAGMAQLGRAAEPGSAGAPPCRAPRPGAGHGAPAAARFRAAAAATGAAGVITADELAAARRFHGAMVARGERSPFAEVAARALATDPADLVNDVILMAPDTRYGREREHGVACVGQAAAALQAAVVLEDAELLRRGAELALAAALTPVWDWGFIARFPGSPFEIRAFLQASAAQIWRTPSIWRATSSPTPAGSCCSAVWRRTASAPSTSPRGGTSTSIIATSWRCSRPGRLAAYGVLRSDWPRVAPIRSWRIGSCRRAWRNHSE